MSFIGKAFSAAGGWKTAGRAAAGAGKMGYSLGKLGAKAAWGGVNAFSYVSGIPKTHMAGIAGLGMAGMYGLGQLTGQSPMKLASDAVGGYANMVQQNRARPAYGRSEFVQSTQGLNFSLRNRRHG